ncbi:MAG: GTP 3',8-cyclase MoaA [Thermoprotei archaeon]|nr:MAG: GTP 3',8-cyclase MoaA [Thermoprotei archaeon]
MKYLCDPYGRPLTHVRVTVTHRCNYSCVYCHGEGEYITYNNELSVYDYKLIARAIAELSIKFIKITGGEPLIRDDISDILRVFHEECSSSELSMVTNGYFLLDKLEDIVNYVDRINVSLPSLNRDTYAKITGKNGLDRVLKGLEKILDHGIKVKINTVVTRLNYSEIDKLVDYAHSLGVDLSLIELIPLGRGKAVYKVLHESLDEIEATVKSRSTSYYKRPLHNRTVYILPRGTKIEIVKSYGNPMFCRGCTRIRITADGRIKPCLMREDNLVDLRDILSHKIPQDDKVALLIERFKKANLLREPFFK